MLFCDSVREEIEFAPKHQKRSKEEIKAITEQMLTQMELEDFWQQAPFSLSGGQRLRTAMASILSAQPDVLLLDEPTSGQDRRQIEKMMTGIKRQFDLVIFCTHCIETAVTYANHIMVMEGGTISAFGTPQEVFFKESLVNRSSLIQPVIQRYAKRLGIQALTVEQVLEQCA
jgi:energy-coupling factor transport system ATP-binding protein